MKAQGQRLIKFAQQLVRFVIEQYREELITLLQGNADEHRIAEDREIVARDLLNILHRFVVYCCFFVLILTYN
jgi:hypothetical protein